MNRFRFPVFFILFSFLFTFPMMAFADSNENAVSVFQKSSAVQPYFSTAYGYAVFPVVYKGAIIVGGGFGGGKVYKKDAATGTASLAQITVGFQLGGQVFSEIVFFEDERAYNEFTRGGFEFDVNASAVAITAGAQAKAGTMGTTAGASAGPATGTQASNHYRKGMAVFVHTKGGLMFEFSVGGQRFDFKPYK